MENHDKDDLKKFRSDAQWAIVAKLGLAAIGCFVLYQMGMMLYAALILRALVGH